jgi:predicted kinase
MSKVILVCGKICSGKSYYSRSIKDKYNAVIISPDEATYELINNEQGEFYNIFSERLNKYLTKKVGEIVLAGANVIFERGLWSSKDRQEIKEYYKNMGVECEIHYVYVDDDTWKQNIEERNQRVLNGNGGSDFYLDEGLMNKLESIWEEPNEKEYNVLYKVNRKSNKK